MPKTGLGGEIKLSTGNFGHEGMTKLRMLNMYIEPTPSGPGSSIRLPRPGLKLIQTVGNGPIRADFIWGSYQVTVSGTEIYFNASKVGDIPGSDLVTFAFSDEELVVVGNRRAYYVTNSEVSLINDPDMPEDIGDVAFLAGRFVYTDYSSSKFVWSEIGDARSIDGLSFATAAENSSEKIVRVTVLADQLIFFMTLSTEWWYATGDVDAPYSRSQGRKYDKGIGARDSLVCPLDNLAYFLGSDRIIYRSETVPMRRSDFTIEQKLQKLTPYELSLCKAFGVIFAGHLFYVFTTPYDSWALDIALNIWLPFSSFGENNFRINTSYAKQLKRMGDSASGKIFEFDGDSRTDDGDPIKKIVSGYVRQLSSRLTNFNITLECQRGDYDPNVEAFIQMRFSDDDCATWSNSAMAPLGLSGSKVRAIWWQLGAVSPPGRYYEFICNDNVMFAPYSLLFNTYL